MISGEDNEAMQIGPDPDKLFVYHRQQLSAMLDGELSPDEAKFMLRRLQHDTELASCWERWQVCGDMLRGQHNALLPADFAERVTLALANGEATADVSESTGSQVAKPRFARWGGGAAIAASVALLAVFAGRQWSDSAPAPSSAPTPMVAAAPAPVAAPAIPVDPVRGVVADAGAQPAAPMDGASPALAAAALAVAEVPRRAAERRTSAQAQRAASNRRSVQAPRDVAPLTAIAVNAMPVPSRLPDAIAAPEPMTQPFALPAPASGIARPWPRALLSSSDSAYSVGFGQLSRESVFEPFRPRDGAVALPVPASDGSPGSDPVQDLDPRP